MNETCHAGSCQCGAVRFAVASDPIRISICHCRMCQRATGGTHAPLVEFASDSIIWQGVAATFASSEQAERGFCVTCGTPLFYRFFESDTTELMIGAMARPEDFAPSYNYGVESRVAWLDTLDDLPKYETGGGPFNDNPTPVTSRQTAL